MDNYILKCTSSGLTYLFSQLANSGDGRIEFLDPLCVVIKLGVIYFKSSGTRFSIKAHRLSIQDSWTFQGFQRWANSDDRDQLHQLRMPLLYFRGLELGYVPTDDIMIAREVFSYINTIAVKGLKQLKATYENSKKNGSMVKNCIDVYIKTLTHQYSRTEYDTEVIDIGKPTLFVIYKEFMKKWTENDCDVIIRMFKIAEDKESDSVQNEIANAIDHFITAKDLEIDSLRPD